jgi:hypothetical protein
MISNKATVLLKSARQRRQFDPANDADLAEFKFFMDHNTWKNGCPFFLEEPHLDIPAMCKDRYINHMMT